MKIYDDYAPYHWHPCKMEDDEVHECSENATFFGVYIRSDDGLLSHLFDCVSSLDAMAACKAMQEKKYPGVKVGPTLTGTISKEGVHPNPL